MAKKDKKDVYYFPHDYNPTSDPKMLAFIGEFGAVGYGIYWRIVEMLHESAEHTLPLKNYIYLAIAKQMIVDALQVSKIIESCIDDFELFESDEEHFWCNRVLRNVEKRIDLIAKKKKAGDASAAARAAAKAEKEEEERLLNITTQSNTCSTGVQQELTGVKQTATDVQHNSTDGNKLNEIKLNETIQDKTIINNPSNQNINNNISENPKKIALPLKFNQISDELKNCSQTKMFCLQTYKIKDYEYNIFIDWFIGLNNEHSENEIVDFSEWRKHFKNWMKYNYNKLPNNINQEKTSIFISDDTKEKLAKLYISKGVFSLFEKYIKTKGIDESQGYKDFERAQKQKIDYLNLQSRINSNEQIYNY